MNLKRFGKKQAENYSEVVTEEIASNGIENIERKEGTAIIYLSGKIDAANFEQIQEKAFELANLVTTKELIFDMNNVNYVSSAGLRMFSAVNQKAAENELSYKLVKMRKDIMKLFQMTGYASAFYIELREDD